MKKETTFVPSLTERLKTYNKDEKQVAQRFQHGGTQNGGSQSPLGGQRHEERTIRQTYHRHRELVHTVRTGAYPPARSGSDGKSGNRETGVLCS